LAQRALLIHSPWHFLNFTPLPQGHFSFLPTFGIEAIKQALETSLLRYGVFSRVIQNNGADYQLEVALKELKQPFAGFNLTVKSQVHWRLVSTKTGNVIWQQTIDRNFTAGVGDAFVAVHRLELANEGAIRENIKAGLQEMGQLTF
jgi:hypothetical protein